MKTGTLIVCLVLSGLLTGCAPSLKSITDMRTIRGDKEAAKEQETLLQQFVSGGQPAAWRAEAMNTMAHLDFEYMHGLHHRELHDQLVKALKSEYIKPNVAPETPPDDRHRVRAWSIHALSRLDQPFFLDFYANVLADRRLQNDPDYSLRLAAMNGVLREKGQLLKSTDLRQKIFTAAATIKSEIRFKTKFNPVAAKLGNAITQLETDLLSYKDAVNMLPHKSSAYQDDGQFLQLLRWCERGIVEEKAATTHPELYAENIRKLVVLVDHPNPKLRIRVRSILVQYAPLSMLNKLITLTQDAKQLTRDDLELSLRLMEVLDTRKSTLSTSELTTYSTLRTTILKQFFNEISSHSLDTRDYVLGRLLAIDPAVFVQLTYDHREALQKDQLKAAQLYVRYLHHAYDIYKDGDTALKANVTDSLCGWLNSKHLPVRRSVTTTLLKADPERLVYEKAPLFDALADWDHASTAELVDSYIAALLEVETKPDRMAAFTKAFEAKTTQTVYVPLTKALPLRVLPTTQTIARFLAARNPELFLTALSAAMTAKPNNLRSHRLQELILLGDMGVEKQKVIGDDCRKQVVSTLKSNMAPGDTDQALLCLRYVVQLGESLKPEFIAGQTGAVRALYELSTGGQDK